MSILTSVATHSRMTVSRSEGSSGSSYCSRKEGTACETTAQAGLRTSLRTRGLACFEHSGVIRDFTHLETTEHAADEGDVPGHAHALNHVEHGWRHGPCAAREGSAQFRMVSSSRV